jgi:ATP-dependent Zn protease
MKKLSQDYKRKIIAFHEAGHAVICYVLGYDFETITAIPNLNTGSDGAFRRSIIRMSEETKGKTKTEYQIWIMDQIKITLSGGAAVFILTGDPDLLGIHPDSEQAGALAKLITKSDEELKKLITTLAFQAKELVQDKRNWLAINHLAEALMQKEIINYVEALKVIEKTFSIVVYAQGAN